MSGKKAHIIRCVLIAFCTLLGPGPWLHASLARFFYYHLGALFLLFCFFVLAPFIACVALIVSLIVKIFRRQWRTAVLVAAGPVLAGASIFVMARSDLSFDLLRFEIFKSAYMAEVESEKPPLKAWDWQSTGDDIHYLVYDSTGEIAYPQETRSVVWNAEAEKIAKGSAFFSVLHPDQTWAHPYVVIVEHLDGDFYVVTVKNRQPNN